MELERRRCDGVDSCGLGACSHRVRECGECNGAGDAPEDAVQVLAATPDPTPIKHSPVDGAQALVRKRLLGCPIKQLRRAAWIR